MDEKLRSGDLLLVDAGAEFHGYCSDITRTWPVEGRYSSAQREVYEAVLEAHEACIARTKPSESISSLHALSVEVIATGLRNLGVSTDSADWRRYYPHSLGHNLGLDTHDAALVPYSRPFVPGAVFTVEPGLYFPADADVPPGLRGVGVRIEDDVVVTAGGADVLSKGVPVDPDEIEGIARD